MSARFDPVINGAPPPIVISGPSNDHVASNGGRDSPDAVKYSPFVRRSIDPLLFATESGGATDRLC